MRVLLGLGLLLAVFAAVALFHDALQRHLASGREEARAAGPDERVDNGWSRLVVGRPAEREPPPGTGGAGPASAAMIVGPPTGASPEPAQAPPSSGADPRLPAITVVRGQTLRQIALAHYGDAAAISMADVAALARSNGLPSADRIEVGQVIRFPALDELRRARQR